ncbi:helix-turn-helix domain-containing protein [Oxyplasma meridianum]|uniref:Helix-turn-helix domain-containing protein n=1 Tax=Oxyplasma meridianum TaxID=3073602 RepID=A0AAX4NH81_9ARCH
MNIEERERERTKKRGDICMIRSEDGIICIDPALPIFSQIGKKYTMLILAILEHEGLRKNFNEILRSIPHSSSTIISKRLKDLESMKLIVRTESRDSVTYSLTQKGKAVIDSLIPFLKVSEKLEDII